MTGPVHVARGVRVLRRTLQEHAFDLRRADAEAFRAWLSRQLPHWRADPVFDLRCRIRDLRRAHPELKESERRVQAATEADAASPAFDRLQTIEQELQGVNRAVEGLSAALENAPADRTDGLRDKLDQFRDKEQTLRAEQTELEVNSPTRPALLQAQRELQELRRATGVALLEEQLDPLLKQAGHRSGQSGESFEGVAVDVTGRHILPDLLKSGARDSAGHRVHILTGVTLGAADTEIDQLIVRRPVRAAKPVDVLAVVEVKRNLNDVAKGFRQRQDNITWLTGDRAGYSPEQFRTKSFPTGHFDRPAVHAQDGQEFMLDTSSFRLFRRDPESGYFLDRLYFITHPARMWGVSAGEMSRLRHQVATDVHFDLGNDQYLERLLAWVQGLANPVETPDVLRLYAGTNPRARHILFVERDKAADTGG